MCVRVFHQRGHNLVQSYRKCRLAILVRYWMFPTLLIERIIAESTPLWTSPVHSKDIGKWVWRPWSPLVRVPLSEHPEDLVDH